MTDPKRAYVRDRATGRWHEVVRAGALAVDTFCGRSFGESAVDSRTSWPPHRATKVCAACKKIALRRRA